jgi:hypothetical protein
MAMSNKMDDCCSSLTEKMQLRWKIPQIRLVWRTPKPVSLSKTRATFVPTMSQTTTSPIIRVFTPRQRQPVVVFPDLPNAASVRSTGLPCSFGAIIPARTTSCAGSRGTSIGSGGIFVLLETRPAASSQQIVSPACAPSLGTPRTVRLASLAIDRF